VGRVHSLEEAQAAFWGALPPPVAERETVALADALGRVLADDARAPDDVPAFRRATMDGYAVVAGAGVRHRVVGEVRMGAPAPRAVAPGECLAIPTGGMVPEGADAVVPVEHVRRDGDWIEVAPPPQPGANVVLPGEDVRAGEVVVPAGQRLRPPDLGALAAVGLTELAVLRRPRVAVVSTGDEVVPVAVAPPPGKVRDSNAVSLAACVRRDGGEALPAGIVADEPAEVARRLRQALDGADLLLVSGGSSVGERDFVPRTLAAMGAPGLLVHGVRLKPGKPTALAVLGGKVAAALPGHPVSALVVYELLVRPALRYLGGDAAWRAPAGGVYAELAAPVAAPADRDFFCRVRLAAGRAEPLSGGSSLLSTLVRADGMLRVRQGTRLPAGERVWVDLL
jgi:molybdopterin molybdotransferase